ncbi:MAG: hypothetical protein ABI870_05995 [Rhodanobacter sp.]
MKLRTLFATITFGTAICLTTVTAHAQTVDPCTMYLCMAGISGYGASGGPACAPALAYWHAPSPAGLAVWTTYGFIAPASAALRRTYLSTCVGSNAATNAAVLNAIITEWGSVP